MESSETKKTKAKDDNAGGFKETILTIVYAGLIALGIRSFAYEPFSIPSGSMTVTL